MRPQTPELPHRQTEPIPSRVSFAHAARGAAVALVAWFHLGETFLREYKVIRPFALLPPMDALPRPWYLPAAELARTAHFNAGLLGVALFFLVSGFVIPFSLDRGSLSRFVIRRIFRLYPVYWLSLALLWGLLHWRAN